MEEVKTIDSILKETYSDLQLNDNGQVDFYTSVADEYDSLIHGVGIRDVSFYNKLFVHGKHSLDLLNRLSTNSVNELNELEWERTIFTNTEGNIIDRTLLLKFEDYFLLIGGCTDNNKLLKWIKRFVLKDDISIRHVANDYSMFEILGPESESYLSIILGEKQKDLQQNKIVRVQIENYFVHCIKHNDVSNINKCIVIVDSKYSNDFCNFLIKNTSAFNLNFVGESAYNVFRIESGIPIAPNELNDQFNPCEANLLNEIDSKKKGYVGCEQIKNGDFIPAESKLCGIKFNEKINDENLNLTIHDEHGSQVGVVTSISSSIVLENSIGLGYISSDVETKELIAMNGTNNFNIALTGFPIKR